MWIVAMLIALAVALVVWRVVVTRKRRSRPIDSGHPHLTDTDPHPPGR